MVNYIYAYEIEPTDIPDLIFQGYYKLLKGLDLPFFISTFIIGLVNSCTIIFFARNKVPRYTFLVFVIFFAHLIVVRDFAQMRISFAFSFFLLALMNKKALRFIFIVIAIGIHKSIIVLILVYFFTEFYVRQTQSTKRMLFLLSLSGGVLLYAGIEYLLFLDPRIEIYLSWDKDGYGNTVSSYGSVLFQILLLLVYFGVAGFKGWSSNIYLMLTVFGILAFIALSPTAIFAFRLSNLVWSFYPFLVLDIIERSRSKFIKPVHYTITMTTIVMLIIFIVNRPGSFRIINSIQF